MTIHDGDTFEHNGRNFRATFSIDDIQETPWEWADGHGVVSEWARRDKAPGERILATDGFRKQFYDFAATMKIAKRDAWGLGEDALAALSERLGRAPTRGEIIAESVERDFNYLKDWCDDKWHYVCVCVDLLDEDGELTGDSDSLGMVEDNDSKYLDSVARECADNILSEVKGRRDREDTLAAARMEAARPDMYSAQSL